MAFPLPSRIPGSAEHGGRPLAPAAWHLRGGGGHPAGSRPAPGLRPVAKGARFPLSRGVNSARLAKSGCGLVRTVVWEVQEARTKAARFTWCSPQAARFSLALRSCPLPGQPGWADKIEEGVCDLLGPSPSLTIIIPWR